ncbi:hypothetical protein [Verrucomicrobium sp. BvORR034]|jgi:hypothetical protein|uniref:hypothetical protein n=1 Tax=Verrucomicrobium sp. BvORR034 TaxID=1396418 RepID=UPI000679108A|nr:hypothetical protein [Verrucomicrobium sp. BvORR034]
MSSKNRSTKLPPDLADAAELRAKALGYASWSAYIKALIRYDLVVQGHHTLTLPWSHQPPDRQDEIDAHLLTLTKRGAGERGQLLEHILERVRDPAKVAEGLREAA